MPILASGPDTGVTEPGTGVTDDIVESGSIVAEKGVDNGWSGHHLPSSSPGQREVPRPVSTTVTMYSTPWCGYCHRLKAQMDREGISYEVVDIEAHPEAAEIVMSVNGGNQTVPTLVFPDGSALTNPSVAQVKEKLVA